MHNQFWPRNNPWSFMGFLSAIYKYDRNCYNHRDGTISVVIKLITIWFVCILAGASFAQPAGTVMPEMGIPCSGPSDSIGFICARSSGPSNMGGSSFNYYVNSVTGNDSNSCTSMGAPCLTLAHVQTIAVAGSRICLVSGSVFREGVAPISGQTWANCGGITLARVTGADQLTSGLWSATPIQAIDNQTFASGGLSGTYWTNTNGTFPTSPVQGASTHSYQSTAGAAAGMQTTLSPNSNVMEMDFYYQLQASTATSGQKTRVASMEGTGWNGGNAVCVWISFNGTNFQLSVGRGAAIGGTTFNVTTGTWYLIRFLVSANGGASTDFSQLYVDGTLRSSLSSLSLTSAVNADLRTGGFGAFNDVFTNNYDSLSVYTQNSTNSSTIWQATVTTQPNVLTYDGTLGLPAASIAALSSLGQWFWSTNTLYFYNSSSVDNPSQTFTAAGIEIGARNNPITITAGATNVTIDGLDVSHNNGTSSQNIWSVHNASPENDNLLVQNSILRDSPWTCMFMDSNNGISRNNNYHDCVNIGLDIDSGTNESSINDTFNNIQFSWTRGLAGGSAIYPGAIFPGHMTFNIVNAHITNAVQGVKIDNAVSGTITGANINTTTFDSIVIDGLTTNITVNQCVFANAGENFFHVYNNFGTNIGFLLEASYGYNATQGAIDIENASTGSVLNFSSYSTTGYGLKAGSASTAVTLKNSIFQGATSTGLLGDGVAVVTEDYNDIYNFSTARTNVSAGTHSITTNPLYTTPGSGVLTLQGGSAAIAAGVIGTGVLVDVIGTAYGNPPSMGAYGP